MTAAPQTCPRCHGNFIPAHPGECFCYFCQEELMAEKARRTLQSQFSPEDLAERQRAQHRAAVNRYNARLRANKAIQGDQ